MVWGTDHVKLKVIHITSQGWEQKKLSQWNLGFNVSVSFFFFPCNPTYKMYKTVSEVTTSKQPCIQLWVKKWSVKSGNDWSFELHSTQCFEIKLLWNYFSIRRGQWLPSPCSISEYLSDYSHYRWLLLAPSTLLVGNSSVKEGPRYPSSPVQDNSRHLHGAGQCDIPTIPARCQQKSSQNCSVIPVTENKHNNNLHQSFST